jgi:hypothetical protein
MAPVKTRTGRRHHRPVTAGSVLRNTLKRLGLQAGVSRHRVLHLWPKIVEPTVAGHARAERVVGSTLHVIVDSSVWMNELAAVRTLLLDKVNSCLDRDAAPITEIRFTQRSWAKPPKRDEQKSEPTALTEEDEQVVAKVLEPLADDDLRVVLRRILEKDRMLKKRRDAASDADRPST